ncbi:hypothetical protein MIND_00368400 [Mycena indigotica]|uniref:Uncharacterized protein n=1 Tax=Mycena indigotica TaxID=2126181 RepID=A0A8H6T1J7_9AGAR|nr:uncharacterized protein MIND_00368400 [Mycena indigotica]KAF7309958.1 hypothetical protein MIND_00368400 [Mycena indigotica]
MLSKIFDILSCLDMTELIVIKARCRQNIVNDMARPISDLYQYPKKSPWVFSIPQILSTSGSGESVTSQRLIKAATREIHNVVSGKHPHYECFEDLKAEYAKRAHDRPLVENLGHQLSLNWAPFYVTEHQVVLRRNLEFIRSMAKMERIKHQTALHCPRLKKLLITFNRDLSLLTLSVWVHNRIEILTELNTMLGGRIRRPEIANTEEIDCPVCNEVFRVIGIMDHVIESHPEIDPNEFSLKPKDVVYCRQCVGADRRRMFTLAGLEMHKTSEHDPSHLKVSCDLCEPTTRNKQRKFSSAGLAAHIFAKHPGQ